MAKNYISQLTTRVQGLEGGLLHTGPGLASGQGLLDPSSAHTDGNNRALVDQTQSQYWDKHKTEVSIRERDIEIEKISLELVSTRRENQRLQESIKEMELSMVALLHQSEDQSQQANDVAATKESMEAMVVGLAEQCEKQDNQLSRLRSHLDEILIEKVECSVK